MGIASLNFVECYSTKLEIRSGYVFYSKGEFYVNSLFNPIRKYVQSCLICHIRSAKEPGGHRGQLIHGLNKYHLLVGWIFQNSLLLNTFINWNSF